MPRKYIRKTARQNWSESAMLEALDAVKNCMPYKTASKQFLVPLMSLKRRAKGKNVHAVGGVKVLGSFKKVFTEEQELELVQYITDNEETMYGLTIEDVLKFAYTVAERNNIRHPFFATTHKAGKDWLKGFRQRHPNITLRAPESTSAGRARAFNKPIVHKFYDILKKVQEEKSFPPHRIFNVDETSLSTVPTKNTKIFAKKGRKQVARITSAERGESTTAVICGSAGGNFIPPMLIFRRLRMKIELMDGAPPGSVYACNPSGWMNIEVFSQWFDHFLAHTKPSAEDPVLLVLDGHLSHTRNLDVIIKARQNHVTILCLPPHCTHKLQPLDVAVMYPLSVYHNQALEKWMNNHAGRVVSVFQISRIFGEAYLKAAVPLNIIKGFEKCGISPFNPDVFTDVDFVAATTTEQEEDNTFVQPRPSTSAAPDTIQDSGEVMADNLPSTSPSEVLNEVEEPSVHGTVSPSLLSTPMEMTQTLISLRASPPPQEQTVTSPPIAIQLPDVVTDRPSCNTPVLQLLSPLTARSELAVMDKNRRSVSPIASTSFTIPPRQIQPLPKMEGRRTTNAKKSQASTVVLTSTPYKNFLEEERDKKAENEAKKMDRMIKKGLIKTTLKKKKDNLKGKENVAKKRKQTGKPPKPKKNKKEISESSSSDEEDTECLFCTQKYSRDHRGEGWIRCSDCLKWGHDECAGVDPNDADDFICDYCVSKRFGNARKNLNL